MPGSTILNRVFKAGLSGKEQTPEEDEDVALKSSRRSTFHPLPSRLLLRSPGQDAVVLP